VRILSLLVVVLTGCYDPTVDDCQFSCPDGECPGELTCEGGFCRAPGAAGTPTSCSCATPPVGCSLVTNTAGLCLAACSTERAWSAAQTACGATAGWQLAVLDSPSTLAAARTALKTPPSWIGLARSNALAVEWTWTDGSGQVSSAAPEWTSGANSGVGIVYTCAALNNGKLYSDACETPHAYACTPN
jgi:lectin-like protein